MPIPIKEIADNLTEERCVLLLGPNTAVNTQGEPMQDALLAHLEKEGYPVGEDIDGLCRCDEATRQRLYTPIKAYYRENAAPSDLHEQLARIPAHLIISLTPDHLLPAAFSGLNLPHDFSHYAKLSAPAEIEAPSKERPLIYNLFGSIEDESSLILTHRDLVQFIFSIIRDFRLPDILRDMVSKARYFVFLGFDFDKWYLQLLLNLFHLSRGRLSQAAEPPDLTPAELRDFYARNYGLEFVNTGVAEYVQELYEHCRDEGMLREGQELDRVSPREQLFGLLKAAESGQVIDRLSEQLPPGELYNEVIGLAQHHSRLTRRIRAGELTQEQTDAEWAKMTGKLTALIDEALPPGDE